MEENYILEKEYIQWVSELKQRVSQMQLKAAISVNEEMIRLYWSIGEDIINRKAEAVWGKNFYKRMSHDLSHIFPGMKGFSVRNLQYMAQMYSTFSRIESFTPQVVAKLQTGAKKELTPQAVAQIIKDSVCRIPWGHIRYILDKRWDLEESFFYVQKILSNGWSRAVLLNMIDTKLYESQGKSINNFQRTLPDTQSDYAQEILKDPYNFDFLMLREDYKERELQKALEENISRFLLELGNGFAFVGRQVKLEVNGDEYFCDLLFYHIKLRRYVVIELKVVKFEPEFVSKLNFYCSAVNHLIKEDGDNDTIGLLICKEKNDIVAQWTVEKSHEPISISEYELKNLIPTEQNILPSEEDIREKLENP